MERRDFLRTGAAGGLIGLTGAGCGAALQGVQVPSVADLLALDMDGFLGRLDLSLGHLRSSGSLDSVVAPSVIAAARDEARFARSDELVRSSFRSLLLVGSFGDLTEAGRAHPGMQARMWNSMAEMDDAVLGMHATLTSLTPTERADISRALRADPSLGARVLDAIDTEAERAGVPKGRREHLSRFSDRVMFRMRQSMNGLTDDLDETVKKVSVRDGSLEESERRLMASLGERVFWEEHARQTALAQAWSRVPGLAQPLPPPPPATPVVPPGQEPLTSTGRPISVYLSPDEPRPLRGTWTLRAGGILLGMAALRAAAGAILLALGGAGIALGALDLTQGACLLVAGIVTLIVGGVQRWSAASSASSP